MRSAVISISMALLTACTSRSSVSVTSSGSRAGPDPSGCYALVFDQPQFAGDREYINGPRKYTTLTDLPFRANWHRRIRSVQAGPRASVIMWTNEGLRGQSQRVAPNASQAVLDQPLSGRVESLEVECAS